jgi:hypothetical protein
MRKNNEKEKIRGARFALAALTILFCLSGAGIAQAKPLKIKLFFFQPDAEYSDCGAVGVAYRKIPNTKQVARETLKLLFAGPTAEEKAKGMQGIEKLGALFIGITIKNRKAIINFRPGAEKYLYVSGPICISQTVLAPIEKTLLQFRNIKSFDYAINGKIIEDWDA